MVQKNENGEHPMGTGAMVKCGIFIIGSISGLWFLIDQLTGIFVGLWVPSILSFGALVRKGN
ncbi:MAG: hypothetical protein CM1200mP38_7290 [Dehalococcoidia bacterium]|nr:MAG: hypothetical protein CM1200mP38_7290 [Dehalococcoidia bacterium]